MVLRGNARSLVLCCALLLTASNVCAQKKYDPGASDTEIKLGQTMPYSGPASAFATMGRTEAAYFQKVNEEGGIRGRRITYCRWTTATVLRRRWNRRAV